LDQKVKILERSRDLLQPMAGTPAERMALSNAQAFLGIVTYRMGEYPAGRRLLEDLRGRLVSGS
jgi:hypothetical protein